MLGTSTSGIGSLGTGGTGCDLTGSAGGLGGAGFGGVGYKEGLGKKGIIGLSSSSKKGAGVHGIVEGLQMSMSASGNFSGSSSIDWLMLKSKKKHLSA